MFAAASVVERAGEGGPKADDQVAQQRRLHPRRSKHCLRPRGVRVPRPADMGGPGRSKSHVEAPVARVGGTGGLPGKMIRLACKTRARRNGLERWKGRVRGGDR